ncbi:TusE/DsrC/DsvC family sulfur relay protein [Bacteroidota bacterium]
MGNTTQSEVEKIDCNGFFTDSDFWSVEAAENLAKAHEIVEDKLTEKHWKVINFVREFYDKNGRGPSIIKVVKGTGLKLDEICSLFSCGLVKGAYKLAGLPRPPGCV